MRRMSLELDMELYRQLKRAAEANHLTLEQECLRRLESGERPSPYMQALLAELRADEEQRRVNEQMS
ncbi:hypothetical protein D3C76_363650 [compost metagenome]